MSLELSILLFFLQLSFITNERSIKSGPVHSLFHIELICAQKLYESIRNEPFKIPEDDGNDLTHTFFNPDREGWLLKLGTFMACPFLLTTQMII